MVTGQMNIVVRHLRQAAVAEGTSLTDGQLMRRFLDGRDEAAFETLVRRHGSMVLGVCRRVLGNVHDAEDAFQVTFLVLVRKASALAGREVVGDWLHGVAYRTALKARTAAARRRAKEKAMPRRQARTDDREPELHALLDRELNGLPAKYRVPIVLCDLEGKTQREAARQLSWPEGTVSGRLSRGRALLARRLSRHGFTALGGALLATLLQDGVSACVPTALVHHTVSAATALVAGQTAAAGAISAQVAALMEGVLKAMLVTKLKITAGVLLLGLLGIIASAGGWATWAAEQPRPEPLADPAPRRAEERKHAAAQDSTEASALLPTGPMPIPFLVRVDSDGQLITTRKVTIHQPVTEESPDGKPVTYYKAIEALTTERFELARTKLVVYNTQGKTIELKALPRLLRKETVAMLLAAGQRIDVRLLRLFKEDTLFFVVPALYASTPQPLPPPMVVPAPSLIPAPGPAVVTPAIPPPITEAVPPQPTTSKQPPTCWLNSKRITIHYSTKVAGRAGLGAVELWHTQDDGRTWSQYAEKTDLTQPFVVDVANEGRHGFLVVVRSGDVLSRERPRPGDSPMVWVEVDVTPPTLRLFSLEHRVDSDKLVVTWNAHDKNLAAKPISFYYSTSSDGPWQLIATGLENSGRCELDLPETLSGAASPCLRVQATDRAGNVAAAEKPIPRGSIASSRPEGSILRVEPAAGPPH